MALIPNFFFNSVVSIGTYANEVIKWIGTGFLVGRKEASTESYTIFLITNLHLIENKEDIYVRFNKKDSNENEDCEIKLIDGEQTLYSKHPDADVAAIQLSPAYLDNNQIEYSWFSLDRHSLILSEMQNTDVIEGCLVYSLGYPISMIETNKNRPMCRLGCISRISDLFSNHEKNEYLVDLQTLPGNSGSPVINRPENSCIEGTVNNISANLIGIISGTIDYSEICENTTCHLEREKSSGFSIVHTVDTIKEVVEMEYTRKKVGV